MALTININGLTLCHRGSDGITHNTLPDVCKTPTKGIPLPYENEAYSKDIANGTVTVSADGGNMAAKLGCIFAKSVFDEGGSMGGIISGTFIAEADFITHSFDVFLEGSPACRLTDKMWMNHRNTVNMGGLTQAQLAALRKQIQDWICECQSDVKPVKDDGKTKKTCTELGNERHDCMEQKKKKQNDADQKKGKKPTHGDEKGYKVKNGKIERTDDITKRRVENSANASNRLDAAKTNADNAATKASRANAAARYTRNYRRGPGRRSSGGLDSAGEDWGMEKAEKDFAAEAKKAEAEFEQARKEIDDAEQALKDANNVRRHKGHDYPDGSVLDEDGKIVELSEYKFVCEEGNPTYRKKDGTLGPPSKGESTGDWGRNQEKKYKRLGKAMDKDAKAKGETKPNTKLKKYSAADCPGVGGGSGDDAKKSDKSSSSGKGKGRKGKR